MLNIIMLSAFLWLSYPSSYQSMHELLVNLVICENKAFVLPVTRNLPPIEVIHSIFLGDFNYYSVLFHVELQKSVSLQFLSMVCVCLLRLTE